MFMLDKVFFIRLLLVFLTSTLSYNLAFAAKNADIQVIELHGNFKQMGRQYADQLGPILLKQLKLAKRTLRPRNLLDSDTALFDETITSAIDAAMKRYSPEILKIIQGEAESDFAKEHDLTVRDFVYLDQATAISMLVRYFEYAIQPGFTGNCSFIGFDDNGSHIGRNFDWLSGYMNVFTNYPVITLFKHSNHKKYPNKVASVGNAGNISSITLMNDKGLFIGINSAVSASGDFQVWHRQSYFAQMTHMMFSAQTFSDLQAWLQKTPPDYGYIVNISGPNNNELMSYEVLPFDEEQGHYDENNSQNNMIPYDVFVARQRIKNPDENFLVATNIFLLPEWEKHLLQPPKQQTETFSKERQDNLTALAHLAMASQNDNTGHFNWNATLKRIMEAPLDMDSEVRGATEYLCKSDDVFITNPDSTYYSVVFDSKKLILQVRYQQVLNKPLSKYENKHCRSTWTKWKSVRL